MASSRKTPRSHSRRSRKPAPVEVNANGFPTNPTNREVRRIIKFIEAQAKFWHGEATRLAAGDTVRGFTPESREATGKWAVLSQTAEDLRKAEHMGKQWKDEE